MHTQSEQNQDWLELEICSLCSECFDAEETATCIECHTALCRSCAKTLDQQGILRCVNCRPTAVVRSIDLPGSEAQTAMVISAQQALDVTPRQELRHASRALCRSLARLMANGGSGLARQVRRALNAVYLLARLQARRLTRRTRRLRTVSLRSYHTARARSASLLGRMRVLTPRQLPALASAPASTRLRVRVQRAFSRSRS